MCALLAIVKYVNFCTMSSFKRTDRVVKIDVFRTSWALFGTEMVGHMIEEVLPTHMIEAVLPTSLGRRPGAPGGERAHVRPPRPRQTGQLVYHEFPQTDGSCSKHRSLLHELGAARDRDGRPYDQGGTTHIT